MPVLTPHVPDGLIDIMKALTKSILKEKPENIYEFAVQHFEKLIAERDGSLEKGYEMFRSEQAYFQTREKYEKIILKSHYRQDSPNKSLTQKIDTSDLEKDNQPSLSAQRKLKARKLSSRKPSQTLIVIKEDDDEEAIKSEIENEMLRRERAAFKIQKAFKGFLERLKQDKGSHMSEQVAALIIQRTLRTLFSRRLKEKQATMEPQKCKLENVNRSSEGFVGIDKEDEKYHKDSFQDQTFAESTYETKIKAPLRQNSDDQHPSIAFGERCSGEEDIKEDVRLSESVAKILDTDASGVSNEKEEMGSHLDDTTVAAELVKSDSMNEVLNAPGMSAEQASLIKTMEGTRKENEYLNVNDTSTNQESPKKTTDEGENHHFDTNDAPAKVDMGNVQENLTTDTEAIPCEIKSVNRKNDLSVEQQDIQPKIESSEVVKHISTEQESLIKAMEEVRFVCDKPEVNKVLPVQNRSFDDESLLKPMENIQHEIEISNTRQDTVEMQLPIEQESLVDAMDEVQMKKIELETTGLNFSNAQFDEKQSSSEDLNRTQYSEKGLNRVEIKSSISKSLESDKFDRKSSELDEPIAHTSTVNLEVDSETAMDNTMKAQEGDNAKQISIESIENNLNAMKCAIEAASGDDKNSNRIPSASADSNISLKKSLEDMNSAEKTAEPMKETSPGEIQNHDAGEKISATKNEFENYSKGTHNATTLVPQASLLKSEPQKVSGLESKQILNKSATSVENESINENQKTTVVEESSDTCPEVNSHEHQSLMQVLKEQKMFIHEERKNAKYPDLNYLQSETNVEPKAEGSIASEHDRNINISHDNQSIGRTMFGTSENPNSISGSSKTISVADTVSKVEDIAISDAQSLRNAPLIASALNSVSSTITTNILTPIKESSLQDEAENINKRDDEQNINGQNQNQIVDSSSKTTIDILPETSTDVVPELKEINPEKEEASKTDFLKSHEGIEIDTKVNQCDTDENLTSEANKLHPEQLAKTIKSAETMIPATSLQETTINVNETTNENNQSQLNNKEIIANNEKQCDKTVSSFSRENQASKHDSPSKDIHNPENATPLTENIRDMNVVSASRKDVVHEKVSSEKLSDAQNENFVENQLIEKEEASALKEIKAEDVGEQEYNSNIEIAKCPEDTELPIREHEVESSKSLGNGANEDMSTNASNENFAKSHSTSIASENPDNQMMLDSKLCNAQEAEEETNLPVKAEENFRRAKRSIEMNQIPVIDDEKANDASTDQESLAESLRDFKTKSELKDFSVNNKKAKSKEDENKIEDMLQTYQAIGIETNEKEVNDTEDKKVTAVESEDSPADNANKQEIKAEQGEHFCGTENLNNISKKDNEDISNQNAEDITKDSFALVIGNSKENSKTSSDILPNKRSDSAVTPTDVSSITYEVSSNHEPLSAGNLDFDGTGEHSVLILGDGDTKENYAGNTFTQNNSHQIAIGETRYIDHEGKNTALFETAYDTVELNSVQDFIESNKVEENLVDAIHDLEVVRENLSDINSIPDLINIEAKDEKASDTKATKETIEIDDILKRNVKENCDDLNDMGTMPQNVPDYGLEDLLENTGNILREESRRESTQDTMGNSYNIKVDKILNDDDLRHDHKTILFQEQVKEALFAKGHANSLDNSEEPMKDNAIDNIESRPVSSFMNKKSNVPTSIIDTKDSSEVNVDCAYSIDDHVIELNPQVHTKDLVMSKEAQLVESDDLLSIDEDNNLKIAGINNSSLSLQKGSSQEDNKSTIDNMNENVDSRIEFLNSEPSLTSRNQSAVRKEFINQQSLENKDQGLMEENKDYNDKSPSVVVGKTNSNKVDEDDVELEKNTENFLIKGSLSSRQSIDKDDNELKDEGKKISETQVSSSNDDYTFQQEIDEQLFFKNEESNSEIINQSNLEDPNLNKMLEKNADAVHTYILPVDEDKITDEDLNKGNSHHIKVEKIINEDDLTNDDIFFEEPAKEALFTKEHANSLDNNEEPMKDNAIENKIESRPVSPLTNKESNVPAIIINIKDSSKFNDHGESIDEQQVELNPQLYIKDLMISEEAKLVVPDDPPSMNEDNHLKIANKNDSSLSIQKNSSQESLTNNVDSRIEVLNSEPNATSPNQNDVGKQFINEKSLETENQILMEKTEGSINKSHSVLVEEIMTNNEHVDDIKVKEITESFLIERSLSPRQSINKDDNECKNEGKKISVTDVSSTNDDNTDQENIIQNFVFKNKDPNSELISQSNVEDSYLNQMLENNADAVHAYILPVGEDEINNKDLNKTTTQPNVYETEQFDELDPVLENDDELNRNDLVTADISSVTTEESFYNKPDEAINSLKHVTYAEHIQKEDELSNKVIPDKDINKNGSSSEIIPTSRNENFKEQSNADRPFSNESITPIQKDSDVIVEKSLGNTPSPESKANFKSKNQHTSNNDMDQDVNNELISINTPLNVNTDEDSEALLDENDELENTRMYKVVSDGKSVDILLLDGSPGSDWVSDERTLTNKMVDDDIDKSRNADHSCQIEGPIDTDSTAVKSLNTTEMLPNFEKGRFVSNDSDEVDRANHESIVHGTKKLSTENQDAGGISKVEALQNLKDSNSDDTLNETKDSTMINALSIENSTGKELTLSNMHYLNAIDDLIIQPTSPSGNETLEKDIDCRDQPGYPVSNALKSVSQDNQNDDQDQQTYTEEISIKETKESPRDNPQMIVQPDPFEHLLVQIPGNPLCSEYQQRIEENDDQSAGKFLRESNGLSEEITSSRISTKNPDFPSVPEEPQNLSSGNDTELNLNSVGNDDESYQSQSSIESNNNMPIKVSDSIVRSSAVTNKLNQIHSILDDLISPNEQNDADNLIEPISSQTNHIDATYKEKNDSLTITEKLDGLHTEDITFNIDPNQKEVEIMDNLSLVINELKSSSILPEEIDENLSMTNSKDVADDDIQQINESFRIIKSGSSDKVLQNDNVIENNVSEIKGISNDSVQNNSVRTIKSEDSSKSAETNQLSSKPKEALNPLENYNQKKKEPKAQTEKIGEISGANGGEVNHDGSTIESMMISLDDLNLNEKGLNESTPPKVSESEEENQHKENSIPKENIRPPNIIDSTLVSLEKLNQNNVQESNDPTDSEIFDSQQVESPSENEDNTENLKILNGTETKPEECLVDSKSIIAEDLKLESKKVSNEATEEFCNLSQTEENAGIKHAASSIRKKRSLHPNEYSDHEEENHNPEASKSPELETSIEIPVTNEDIENHEQLADRLEKLRSTEPAIKDSLNFDKIAAMNVLKETYGEPEIEISKENETNLHGTLSEEFEKIEEAKRTIADLSEVEQKNLQDSIDICESNEEVKNMDNPSVVINELKSSSILPEEIDENLSMTNSKDVADDDIQQINESFRIINSGSSDKVLQNDNLIENNVSEIKGISNDSVQNDSVRTIKSEDSSKSAQTNQHSSKPKEALNSLENYNQKKKEPKAQTEKIGEISGANGGEVNHDGSTIESMMISLDELNLNEKGLNESTPPKVSESEEENQHKENSIPKENIRPPNIIDSTLVSLEKLNQNNVQESNDPTDSEIFDSQKVESPSENEDNTENLKILNGTETKPEECLVDSKSIIAEDLKLESKNVLNEATEEFCNLSQTEENDGIKDAVSSIRKKRSLHPNEFSDDHEEENHNPQALKLPELETSIEIPVTNENIENHEQLADTLEKLRSTVPAIKDSLNFDKIAEMNVLKETYDEPEIEISKENETSLHRTLSEELEKIEEPKRTMADSIDICESNASPIHKTEDESLQIADDLKPINESLEASDQQMNYQSSSSAKDKGDKCRTKEILEHFPDVIGRDSHLEGNSASALDNANANLENSKKSVDDFQLKEIHNSIPQGDFKNLKSDQQNESSSVQMEDSTNELDNVQKEETDIDGKSPDNHIHHSDNDHESTLAPIEEEIIQKVDVKVLTEDISNKNKWSFTSSAGSEDLDPDKLGTSTAGEVEPFCIPTSLEPTSDNIAICSNCVIDDHWKHQFSDDFVNMNDELKEDDKLNERLSPCLKNADSFISPNPDLLSNDSKAIEGKDTGSVYLKDEQNIMKTNGENQTIPDRAEQSIEKTSSHVNTLNKLAPKDSFSKLLSIDGTYKKTSDKSEENYRKLDQIDTNNNAAQHDSSKSELIYKYPSGMSFNDLYKDPATSQDVYKAIKHSITIQEDNGETETTKKDDADLYTKKHSTLSAGSTKNEQTIPEKIHSDLLDLISSEPNVKPSPTHKSTEDRYNKWMTPRSGYEPRQGVDNDCTNIFEQEHNDSQSTYPNDFDPDTLNDAESISVPEDTTPFDSLNALPSLHIQGDIKVSDLGENEQGNQTVLEKDHINDGVDMKRTTSSGIDYKNVEQVLEEKQFGTLESVPTHVNSNNPISDQQESSADIEDAASQGIPKDFETGEPIIDYSVLGSKISNQSEIFNKTPSEQQRNQSGSILNAEAMPDIEAYKETDPEIYKIPEQIDTAFKDESNVLIGQRKSAIDCQTIPETLDSIKHAIETSNRPEHIVDINPSLTSSNIVTAKINGAHDIVPQNKGIEKDATYSNDPSHENDFNKYEKIEIPSENNDPLLSSNQNETRLSNQDQISSHSTEKEEIIENEISESNKSLIAKESLDIFNAAADSIQRAFKSFNDLNIKDSEDKDVKITAQALDLDQSVKDSVVKMNDEMKNMPQTKGKWFVGDDPIVTTKENDNENLEDLGDVLDDMKIEMTEDKPHKLNENPQIADSSFHEEEASLSSIHLEEAANPNDREAISSHNENMEETSSSSKLDNDHILIHSEDTLHSGIMSNSKSHLDAMNETSKQLQDAEVGEYKQDDHFKDLTEDAIITKADVLENQLDAKKSSQKSNANLNSKVPSAINIMMRSANSQEIIDNVSLKIQDENELVDKQNYDSKSMKSISNRTEEYPALSDKHQSNSSLKDFMIFTTSDKSPEEDHEEQNDSPSIQSIEKHPTAKYELFKSTEQESVYVQNEEESKHSDEKDECLSSNKLMVFITSDDPVGKDQLENLEGNALNADISNELGVENITEIDNNLEESNHQSQLILLQLSAETLDDLVDDTNDSTLTDAHHRGDPAEIIVSTLDTVANQKSTDESLINFDESTRSSDESTLKPDEPILKSNGLESPLKSDDAGIKKDKDSDIIPGASHLEPNTDQNSVSSPTTQEESPRSDVENMDLSIYGEDSLEAMYYSLRKHEYLLDKMHKQASVCKSASTEKVKESHDPCDPKEEIKANEDQEIQSKHQSEDVSSSVVLREISEIQNNEPTTKRDVDPPEISVEIIPPQERKLSRNESYYAACLSRPITSATISPRSKSQHDAEDVVGWSKQKSEEFLQQLHADHSFDDISNEAIRRNILAYSISEADSDYCEPGERTNAIFNDFNISTAFEHTPSTDTDSTIVSAVTKIQAGARGFLTRRRLRRASVATTSFSDRKPSFGNDAIGESLEDLIDEEDAARRIQKSFRRYRNRRTRQSAPTLTQNVVEIDSSKSSTGSSEEGIVPIIEIKVEHKSSASSQNRPSETVVVKDEDSPDNDSSTEKKSSSDTVEPGSSDSGDNQKEFDVSFDGINLAARRMTLQRGDAVQRNSTAEDEGSSVSGTGSSNQSDDAQSSLKKLPQRAKSSGTERREKAFERHNNLERAKRFGTRQRTMPVQIDFEILRVLPKHLRKRIRSADQQNKSKSEF